MRSLFVWTLFTSCIGGTVVGDNSRRVTLATDRSQVSRVETTTSYSDEEAALKVEVESVYDEKSALKVKVESVSDEDCETEWVWVVYEWEKELDIRLQKRAKRSRGEQQNRIAFPRQSLMIRCKKRICKKGTAHTFNQGVGRERC